ncbi:MAG: hypothetical protein HY721_14805 [Planctomycetes bacterium]|nr:hypothetical protein [Planctomycetota bacterium]
MSKESISAQFARSADHVPAVQRGAFAPACPAPLDACHEGGEALRLLRWHLAPEEGCARCGIGAPRVTKSGARIILAALRKGLGQDNEAR